MGIGLVLLYGASRVPLRVWRDRLTPLVLILAFAGLLLVAIPGMPIADDVNGASRWLRVGPLGFQPSDLAKLALVLWLARFLVVNRREVGEWGLLKRAAMVVAPMCVSC
ncbi:MAG: FtsW/RodA/SpoVE family cell cycle protein [Microthrixaceae bacterium]|nr:FtsW/RodA/SpoVE family cell cycle protein [Microthrixaceae bacterium]